MMAEAQGPPRKTKTYHDFSTMASQNEREGTKPDEFFWLENIMRVAPHKLHSVPGPLQKAIYPIVPPPTLCTDTTQRGQQSLAIVKAFDVATPALPETNLHSSWGYINEGELYVLVGSAGCGGGNVSYQSLSFPPPNCVQIFHYLGDNLTIHDDFPVPSGTGLPFTNTRVGTSDVPVWAGASNAYGGMRMYFDLGVTFADMHTDSTNGGGHEISSFCVSGDEVWVFEGPGLDVGPEQVAIVVFDKAGARLARYNIFGTALAAVNNMQGTDDFVYLLAYVYPGPIPAIYKIDRSDGSFVTFNLNNIGPQFIGVANDDLIYVLSNGTPASMQYLVNFTDLIYVGKTTGAGFTPFGFGTGIWNNGTFYYGSNGFSGFSVDIFKILVACPPDGESPIVASVSTDASNPGGSATVNVMWADILEPDSSDRIDLFASVPGQLGFFNSLAHVATGGGASGTVPFTLPGVSAGDYFFALTTENGGILIAKTGDFTVT